MRGLKTFIPIPSASNCDVAKCQNPKWPVSNPQSIDNVWLTMQRASIGLVACCQPGNYAIGQQRPGRAGLYYTCWAIFRVSAPKWPLWKEKRIHRESFR